MAATEKNFDVDIEKPFKGSIIQRRGDDPFLPREGKELTWTNMSMTLVSMPVGINYGTCLFPCLGVVVLNDFHQCIDFVVSL